MDLFYRLRPLLFRLDPETAHRATIAALRLVPRRPLPPADPRLAIRVAGIDFPSPVGLAAGFDKDAHVPDAMLQLGFGFVEVGTLTPRPQAGNPRPRLFRLEEDGAVINRMGFNNGGQAAAAARLARRARRGVVGVNIGANKDSADRVADYVAGVGTMGSHADYLAINISSPNTPGLRDLQAGGELTELLAAVREAREAGGPPVFLKVAPDLQDGDHDRIVRAAIENGIDALIVANTTVSRGVLQSRHRDEAGGLSGRPLRPLALDQLRRFHRASGGRLPLISVGGISHSRDAWARITAGASLIQFYTDLVYRGPMAVRATEDGLKRHVSAMKMASIAEAVGIDA